MQKKVKITKYSYGCDGGSLKLINEQGASINLPNHYGDGEFELYLIESVGWGPAFFDNLEDYQILKNFELQHPSDTILFLHQSKQPSDWKVLFYDCDNEDGDGIVLSRDEYHFISIQQDKDSNFYIYAYYNGKYANETEIRGE